MMISPYYRVVLCGCKNHLKLPFSFGALFWDDSSDQPRLRVWIDGMERERGCPRALTPDEIRAIFSLKRGGVKGIEG